MKRMLLCLLAAALGLGLAGCGRLPDPERAADGLDWGEDWVTVGGVVGVDAPEGMTARENNDALAANGMYYATWSMGEGEPFTNADGEEATLYDAQVYLLLGGYKSEEEAQSALAEWRGMAEEQYAVRGAADEAHNGQDFHIITYAFDSGENPYARGASAFGTYRNFAVNVDFACQAGFEGDEARLLADFLDHCHYAMP